MKSFSDLKFALLFPWILFFLGVVAQSVLAIDFQQTFDRAQGLLDAETDIGVSPKVVFRDINLDDVEKYEGNELIPSAFGFYDLKKDMILIDPNSCLRLTAKCRNAKEAEDKLTVLFLHELIHALQGKILSGAASPAVDSQIFRFLCEGHAVEFSHRIGEKNKISTEDVDSYRVNRGSVYTFNLSDRRKNMMQEFAYKSSINYVRLKCHSLMDFKMLFNGQPTYASIFQALGKKSVVKMDTLNIVPICANASADLVSRLHSNTFDIKKLQYSVAKPLDMPYFDSMSYLCPTLFEDSSVALSFSDAVVTQIIRQNRPVCDVAVYHFNHVSVANTVWEFSKNYRLEQGFKILQENRAVYPILTESSIVLQHPTKGQKISIMKQGNYLVTVTDTDTFFSFHVFQQLVELINVCG